MCEKIDEKFRCRNCGWTEEEENMVRDHCPNCLCSVHEEDGSGFECGGTSQPISIWVKPDDGWEIIQRCSLCGEITSVQLGEDDNPVKLLSIAFSPLGSPPFPVEKMQEMMRLMGGQGDMGGYFGEPRE